MKKKFQIIAIVAISLVSVVTISSCGGKKKAATPVVDNTMPAGEVEVKVFCSGPEYFTTKEHFRANSIGESTDQVTSKKKAMSNVKAELASAINTTIKGTIDNYVNSREYNNKEEVEERFEGLTREVINQELSGTRTICEKLTRTTDGKFKTYIAIELSAGDLVAKMKERITKDERLKVDYDYEKFKETFDKEMEKLEKSR
jgi:hypothetical protein